MAQADAQSCESLKQDGIATAQAGLLMAQVKPASAQVWKRNRHLVRSVLAILYGYFPARLQTGFLRPILPSFSLKQYTRHLRIRLVCLLVWKTLRRVWQTRTSFCSVVNFYTNACSIRVEAGDGQSAVGTEIFSRFTFKSDGIGSRPSVRSCLRVASFG
jgi:hypothetical protein